MVAIDLKEKRLLKDQEIQTEIAASRNYGAWCEEFIFNLSKLAEGKKSFDGANTGKDMLVPLQIAFGYDADELELMLQHMATTGTEPLGSMGDDTPLAVLSRRPRLLYQYFKQLFAQVTNPAIDSIRERAVMSLHMYLGGRLPLFEELPTSRGLLELDTPILFDHEFAAITDLENFKDDVFKLSGLFRKSEGAEGLRKEIHRVVKEAEKMVRDLGIRILVLSDKGVDEDHVAIPMLLLTGAVHQRLVEAGLRLDCDIVCETGEARDVHQFATLLGFGANAVYPYLAYDVIRNLVDEGKIEGMNKESCLQNFRKASDYGLYKIMGKMGISTLFSYQAGQVFEALGLGNEVIEECFYGTPSPIGGIGYCQIGEELIRRHGAGFPAEVVAALELESEGYYRVNRKGGEYHAWNSKVVSGLNRYFKTEEEEDF